jgi:hypothetical protein
LGSFLFYRLIKLFLRHVSKFVRCAMTNRKPRLQNKQRLSTRLLALAWWRHDPFPFRAGHAWRVQTVAGLYVAARQHSSSERFRSQSPVHGAFEGFQSGELTFDLR